MTDNSSISSPPSCTENYWTYDGVRADRWYHIPEFGNTFNWEQTFCCYKRQRRYNFLTWMCFVVLVQGNLCPARQTGQPLLDSFENLCCLERDCEWVDARSKNMYSVCKLLKSISDNFFQTIEVIFFKTVIGLRLAWSEIDALTLLRLCKVDGKTRR